MYVYLSNSVQRINNQNKKIIIYGEKRTHTHLVIMT